MPTEQAAFIAALALGATFLISGLSKLRDLEGFVLGVLEYAVLPRQLAVPFGRVVPVVEVACGLALVLGLWPTAVGILALTLLLSFLVAVAINVARGRQLACHCLGAGSDEPLGWVTLARLGVYAGLGAAVVGWRGSATLAPIPAEPFPALLVALGLLLGLRMLAAIPALWHVWRITVVPSPTLYGGRTSLRNEPLRRHPAGILPNGVDGDRPE